MFVDSVAAAQNPVPTLLPLGCCFCKILCYLYNVTFPRITGQNLLWFYGITKPWVRPRQRCGVSYICRNGHFPSLHRLLGSLYSGQESLSLVKICGERSSIIESFWRHENMFKDCRHCSPKGALLFFFTSTGSTSSNGPSSSNFSVTM